MVPDEGEGLVEAERVAQLHSVATVLNKINSFHIIKFVSKVL